MPNAATLRNCCLLSQLLFSCAFSLSLAYGQNVPAGNTSSHPELILPLAHSTVVTGVAFNRELNVVASVSNDSVLKLWAFPDGNLLQTVNVDEFWSQGLPPNSTDRRVTSGLSSVVFMPNGKGLVTADWSGVIQWKSGGSNLFFRIKSIPEGGVCYEPNGEWLAVASNFGGGSITILKSDEFRVERTIQTPTAILALSVSPDGRQIISGGVENSITAWDVRSGKKLWTLHGHTDYVRSLTFSADGRTLVSGSDDKTVKVWDVRSGVLKNTLQTNSSVQAVSISPDGRFIAAASEGYQISLWKTDGFNLITRWKTTGAARITTFSDADHHPAQWFSGGLTFSRDNKFLAVGRDGSVDILDLDAMKFSHLGRGATIRAVAISPEGQELAVVGKNKIALWDFSMGRPRSYLDALPDHPRGPVSFVSEKELSVRYASGTLRRWNLESGDLVSSVTTDLSEGATGFSADGRLLATSGSNDAETHLWDAVSGQKIRTFVEPLNKGVARFAFNLDGHSIAIASSRGNAISIWDIRTGQKLRDLKCAPPAQLVANLSRVTGASGPCGVSEMAVDPHTGALGAVGIFGGRIWGGPNWGRISSKFDGDAQNGGTAFGAEGRFFVWGTSVWDLAANREAFNLQTRPNSPSFSSDARWLASAGMGEVALWDVEKQTIVARLVSLASPDWLVVSPDGLFDGSLGALNDVVWRFGDKLGDVMPVEAFFSEFYYPGLLSDIAAGKHPLPPEALANLDRRQPAVRISVANDRTSGATGSRTTVLTVAARAVPPDLTHKQSSGARDLRLFRNGSLVKFWHGEIDETKGYSVEVPIIAGANKFTAYAFNDANVKSRDAELIITGARSLVRKPTIYILAVGLNKYANQNYDLRYAAQDAQAFADDLKQKQYELNVSSRVEVIPLLNQDATKGNILTAFQILSGSSPSDQFAPGSAEALKRLRAAQPEDSIFIYFAGHGTSSGSHFYLIPYDLGYEGKREELGSDQLEQIARHSISDEELRNSFEGIDAGKIVLIIDACNSGQALDAEEKRRGPMNSKGLAQLAYEKGMYVLTASQSFQQAIEVDRLGHGLLPFALVEEGLDSSAAFSRESVGDLGVRQWLDYAAHRVPEMLQEMLNEPSSANRGEKQKDTDALARSIQKPRVFYRREPDSTPLIIAKRPVTVPAMFAIPEGPTPDTESHRR